MPIFPITKRFTHTGGRTRSSQCKKRSFRSRIPTLVQWRFGDCRSTAVSKSPLSWRRHRAGPRQCRRPAIRFLKLTKYEFAIRTCAARCYVRSSLFQNAGWLKGVTGIKRLRMRCNVACQFATHARIVFLFEKRLGASACRKPMSSAWKSRGSTPVSIRRQSSSLCGRPGNYVRECSGR